jgi:hypothetical protein
VHTNLRRISAALGVVVFAVGLSACRLTGFNDTPSKSTASSATAWLLTQQQTDGGFEVAGSPGFETPDAILAIAENAQQQYAWDKTQAKNAVLARVKSGHTPLHAIDDLVDGAGLDAGLAAKIIALVAEPLGLSPTAFNPDGDAVTKNLVSVLNAGALPNGSYGVGALNATTYAAIAKRLVDGTVPANTVTFIRNAQQASGGWDFSGVPTSTNLDIDTTAVAIEALVAAGVPITDPDLHAGLVFLANQRRTDGAWQAFGSDDPNSTSTAVDAITAAGFDPNQPCWRNTVVPAQSGLPYVSPLAWLRSQQNADGHINSPNDGFGVNTFATSQSIQALRRGWIPVTPLFPQSCP